MVRKPPKSENRQQWGSGAWSHWSASAEAEAEASGPESSPIRTKSEVNVGS